MADKCCGFQRNFAHDDLTIFSQARQACVLCAKNEVWHDVNPKLARKIGLNNIENI
jgi:hypothetical protein